MVIYSMFSLYLERDFKVSNSGAKIDENFANYFLKPKANTKCFMVQKCTCKGLKKSISELDR